MGSSEIAVESMEKAAGAALTKAELIVAAARKLFLEDGFETTSMDAIAAEAGVSKRTVYSHFQNKESLFAGVMVAICEEVGAPDMEDPPLDEAPEVVLKAAGRRLLDRIRSPQGRAVLRTVLAESVKFPDLGRVFWETGPNALKLHISDYLAEMDRRGRLSVADSDLAAMQFIGLVSGPYLLPLLLGVASPPSDDEIDRVLDGAVDGFLRCLVARRDG